MSLPTNLIAAWPARNVTLAVFDEDGPVASLGDLERPYRLASVTKPLVATAILVAVEEGALDLDAAAGPEGSTVRHLLAHASGLSPDDPTNALAPPATRRIYSNAGFAVLASTLERATGIGLADYLAEGVCLPLGMVATELRGHAGHGAWSTAADLVAWGREFLCPGRLLDPSTVTEAITPQWPHLDGVLPGYGTQRPNPWGLGVELRGTKSPHWTGTANSPATFGHFGQSGTFVWVDPVVGLGVVGLGDVDFGPWAVDCWTVLNDAIVELLRGGHR